MVSTSTVCTRQVNQRPSSYMTVKRFHADVLLKIDVDFTKVTQRDLVMKVSLLKTTFTLEKTSTMASICLNIPLDVYILKPSTSTVKKPMEF